MASSCRSVLWVGEHRGLVRFGRGRAIGPAVSGISKRGRACLVVQARSRQARQLLQPRTLFVFFFFSFFFLFFSPFLFSLPDASLRVSPHSSFRLLISPSHSISFRLFISSHPSHPSHLVISSVGITSVSSISSISLPDCLMAPMRMMMNRPSSIYMKVKAYYGNSPRVTNASAMRKVHSGACARSSFPAWTTRCSWRIYMCLCCRCGPYPAPRIRLKMHIPYPGPSEGSPHVARAEAGARGRDCQVW